MMTCFAGSLLTAPLCGEPLLAGLTEDPKRLVIATALWYALFYLPRDVVYNFVADTKALKVPLYAIKGRFIPCMLHHSARRLQILFTPIWMLRFCLGSCK